MKLNRGQTLLEVVIAIALLVLVLTVMVSATVASMANNRLAKERAIATRLAQSAQDWLRGQRDQLGWTTFSAPFNNGDYCMASLTWTLPSSSCTTPVVSSNASYTRNITISNFGANSLDYRILVEWYSGKAIKESVYVDGKLTKWD